MNICVPALFIEKKTKLYEYTIQRRGSENEKQWFVNDINYFSLFSSSKREWMMEASMIVCEKK
jgi:hypothetical protein